MKRILAIIIAISFLTNLLPGTIFAYDVISLENSVDVTTHFPSVSSRGTSARLTGFVMNNSGKELLTWFDWGDTTDMKKRTPVKRVSASAGRLREFSASVSGLQKGYTYYYQIVVQDIEGNRKVGKTIRFRSDGTAEEYASSKYPTVLGASEQVGPPIVITNDLASNTLNSATLSGTVFPKGSIYTNGYFEWGTTNLLGNKTPMRGLGSKFSMDFAENLTDLKPYTLYYYRAVAQNENGSGWGVTRTFVTGVLGTGWALGTVAPAAQAPAQTTVAPTQYIPQTSTGDSGTTGARITPERRTNILDPLAPIFGTREDTAISQKGSTDGLIAEPKPDVGQTAGVTFSDTERAADDDNGFFPDSFLGWTTLSLLIIVFIGMLMHISRLYEELKQIRARAGNGAGAR